MAKEHLKSLARFTPEPDQQQQLDLIKKDYLGLEPVQLATHFVTIKDHKDNLTKLLGETNQKLEAISQLLLAWLEGQGLSNAHFAGLGTFFTRSEPYSQILDRAALEAWIEQADHQELYTVQWQSLNALVKGLLANNEPPPPGVAVFVKTSLSRRKPAEDLVGSGRELL